MIAVHRLRREEWERKLRSYGCYPAEGLGPLNSAQWWRWPWHGAPFTVPVDDEGYCDRQAFQRLLGDMGRLAPPNWQPPDWFDF
jgi:hypothetical protein